MLNVEKKIRILHKPTSINIVTDVTLDNTSNCLSWALFVANLLNNLYKKLKKFDSENANTFSNAEEENCLSWALFVANLLNNLYKRLKKFDSENANTFSDAEEENFELNDFFKFTRNHGDTNKYNICD